MAEIFKIDKAFNRDRFYGATCVFGVFDGIHAGHRELILDAVEDARSRGTSSFALTFDRDPDELFRPSELRKLMTDERRIEALAASGVDFVAVLPFTREFAALGACMLCFRSRLALPERRSCKRHAHQGAACPGIGRGGERAARSSLERAGYGGCRSRRRRADGDSHGQPFDPR